MNPGMLHDCMALRIAVPSFVLPGTVWQNAVFLRGKVREIGLCLFESESCLAYGDSDLPPALADLSLAWHIHLPLDLSWSHGAEKAASVCLELCEKCAFLTPRLAVLHPPPMYPEEEKAMLLEEFARIWHNSGCLPVFLENTPDCDIVGLGKNFLEKCGFGFCLDVGHALGYAQKELLDSELPEKAGLIHWSAPGPNDRHLPLTGFSILQKKQAAVLMGRMREDASHMLEIFSWRGILESMPVFSELKQFPNVSKKFFDGWI